MAGYFKLVKSIYIYMVGSFKLVNSIWSDIEVIWPRILMVKFVGAELGMASNL